MLLHALLFGRLVASLQAGMHTAQLQIGITFSTEQTHPVVQDYLQTPHRLGGLVTPTVADGMRVAIPLPTA